MKRKNKKPLLKRIFGKRFNLWDFIALFLVFASVIYILVKKGIPGLLDSLADSIFFGFIIAYLLGRIFIKARK